MVKKRFFFSKKKKKLSGTRYWKKINLSMIKVKGYNHCSGYKFGKTTSFSMVLLKIQRHFVQSDSFILILVYQLKFKKSINTWTPLVHVLFRFTQDLYRQGNRDYVIKIVAEKRSSLLNREEILRNQLETVSTCSWKHELYIYIDKSYLLC